MNQSNGFEDKALNVDTDKTQNLELLLNAADFAKFLAMEDSKHYELHKTMGRKKDWIRTSEVSSNTYSNPQGHYI